MDENSVYGRLRVKSANEEPQNPHLRELKAGYRFPNDGKLHKKD